MISPNCIPQLYLEVVDLTVVDQITYNIYNSFQRKRKRFFAFIENSNPSGCLHQDHNQTEITVKYAVNIKKTNNKYLSELECL